jgi:hypothetical protein
VTPPKRPAGRLREHLGISERRQKQASWVMEVLLVGLLFVGLDRGNTGIIVNTGVALGVTQLVPILERDYNLPMDPALTLWITSAVFLHALGTVGLPGAGVSFYRSLPWWDHLTHALSASVVAGVGYAAVRALDEHSEAVVLPRRFVFVFILLFVIAFGVAWEVLEFLLAEGAALVGSQSVLTQYGLEDTMLDLTFDIVGAVVVASWGGAYLSGVVEALSERLA